MHYLKIRNFFVILLLATTICAGVSSAHAEDVDDNIARVSDPLEKANRVVYGFNRILDKVLIKPATKGYMYIVPELARKGVHNVLTNLSEPVTLINSVFQGDVEHSFSTFWRFTINTTWGIGGIFDVAKDAGLTNRKEDFGQTAAVYGSDQGPYLMLPVFGPSNTRDALGMLVDLSIDPFNYILSDEAIATRTVLSGLDTRESVMDLMDHIDRTSLDPYAAIRSLYTQKRWDEIRNGKRAE